MTPTPAKSRVTPTVAIGLVILAAVSWVASTQYTHKRELDLVANYQIGGYDLPPTGWKRAPHGPQTLFSFRKPSSHLLIRGGQSQVISTENPNPELGTDKIADFYVGATRQNMPGWTATVLDSVDAKGTTFRLIRRTTTDKCVISAFAVQGNTTLIVSMSGFGTDAKQIEGELPNFKKFLANISETRQKS